MTLGDKLRFLADRVEDGKPFFMDGVYALDGNVLKIGDAVTIEINKIKSADLKLKPVWEFTEDEKVILRNLEDKFEWVARDEDGELCLFDQKPNKIKSFWEIYHGHYTPFDCFNHLFQSVKWEDDEPCEFREFI